MNKKIFLAAVCSAVFLAGCTKNVENKSLEILLADQTYTVEYTGMLKNSAPDGAASFTGQTENGSFWTAEGNFTSGKLTDAAVSAFPITLKLQEQQYSGTFDGQLDDVLFSGTFTGADDLLYRGDIINGSCSGQGEIENLKYTLTYADRQIDGVYTGEINDSAITGAGTFSSADNTFTYEGGFENGRISGAGILNDEAYVVDFPGVQRAGHYEGDTRDGLAEGQGTFSAINADGIPYSYQGAWKNGQFNGYGAHIYENEHTYKYIGNFKDSIFTPTAQELFTCLGTADNFVYKVNDLANKFLSEHNEIFFDHSTGNYQELTDNEYNYNKFAKNPNTYGDKLIYVKQLKVSSISEFAMNKNLTITSVFAFDSSYHPYYFFYVGTCENVYADSTIEAYLLPLGSGLYTTKLGLRNRALAGAAVWIQ